jgi:hypothetical protein
MAVWDGHRKTGLYLANHGTPHVQFNIKIRPSPQVAVWDGHRKTGLYPQTISYGQPLWLSDGPNRAFKVDPLHGGSLGPPLRIAAISCANHENNLNTTSMGIQHQPLHGGSLGLPCSYNEHTKWTLSTVAVWDCLCASQQYIVPIMNTVSSHIIGHTNLSLSTAAVWDCHFRIATSVVLE